MTNSSQHYRTKEAKSVPLASKKATAEQIRLAEILHIKKDHEDAEVRRKINIIKDVTRNTNEDDIFVTLYDCEMNEAMAIDCLLGRSAAPDVGWQENTRTKKKSEDEKSDEKENLNFEEHIPQRKPKQNARGKSANGSLGRSDDTGGEKAENRKSTAPQTNGRGRGRGGRGGGRGGRGTTGRKAIEESWKKDDKAKEVLEWHVAEEPWDGKSQTYENKAKVDESYRPAPTTGNWADIAQSPNDSWDSQGKMGTFGFGESEPQSAPGSFGAPSAVHASSSSHQQQQSADAQLILSAVSDKKSSTDNLNSVIGVCSPKKFSVQNPVMLPSSNREVVFMPAGTCTVSDFVFGDKTRGSQPSIPPIQSSPPKPNGNSPTKPTAHIGVSGSSSRTAVTSKIEPIGHLSSEPAFNSQKGFGVVGSFTSVSLGHSFGSVGQGPPPSGASSSTSELHLAQSGQSPAQVSSATQQSAPPQPIVASAISSASVNSPPSSSHVPAAVSASSTGSYHHQQLPIQTTVHQPLQAAPGLSQASQQLPAVSAAHQQPPHLTQQARVSMTAYPPHQNLVPAVSSGMYHNQGAGQQQVMPPSSVYDHQQQHAFHNIKVNNFSRNNFPSHMFPGMGYGGQSGAAASHSNDTNPTSNPDMSAAMFLQNSRANMYVQQQHSGTGEMPGIPTSSANRNPVLEGMQNSPVGTDQQSGRRENGSNQQQHHAPLPFMYMTQPQNFSMMDMSKIIATQQQPHPNSFDATQHATDNDHRGGGNQGGMPGYGAPNMAINPQKNFELQRGGGHMDQSKTHMQHFPHQQYMPQHPHHQQNYYMQQAAPPMHHQNMAGMGGDHHRGGSSRGNMGQQNSFKQQNAAGY